MIYLDNAATTLQKPDSVWRSMRNAQRTMASPGRGGHDYAVRAAEAVFKCRVKACELFNVDNPEKVVFTCNATHALNIAIGCYDLNKKDVVVSGFEHNAVMRPLYNCGANIIVAESGLFDYDGTTGAFRRAIKSTTGAVVVNHASNAFGFVQPVVEISEICRENKVPLIIDASQSAGVCGIDAAILKADFIAMPGHKGLYGPQGTGILICSNANRIRPYMLGGTGGNSTLRSMPDFLPDMLEAGTHNVPGIAGLSSGIDFVLQRGTKSIHRYENSLISYARRELSLMNGVSLYEGSTENQDRVGVISFNINGMSCEDAGELLNKYGIAVRAGLHCAPLAHKTAGTINLGTVRMSVSAFTSKNDVSIFLNSVERIIKSRVPGGA